MKRDLPSYCVRLKGVLYFKRRGWPTRRFQNQEVGPAFFAEYATILNGTAPKPRAFLVKGLVDHYYRSPKFTTKKPRTQKDYQKYLDRLEENVGDSEVRDIRRKHVVMWQQQLVKKDGAHFANYFVRVIRILFEYAIDIGELDTNPAKGVGAVKYEKKKPRPWPAEKITLARESLPTSHRTRLLFEMLYCAGERIGDVLSAKWSDVRGEWMEISQNKTGDEGVVPITEELAECLRLAKRYDGVETILANHQGTGPWSYRGAHDAFMKLRRSIGAEEYTFHGIRHTVAAEIVAGGESDEVGMGLTLHQSRQMFAHYSAATRQKVRAKKAQEARKK